MAVPVPNPWMAAAGIIGGGISSYFQNRAIKRMSEGILEAGRMGYETLRDVAAPWLETAKKALPALAGSIERLYGTKVGQDSPRLRGLHEENLRDIGRQREREVGKSRLFWSTRGGGGRGEELRIGRAAEGAERKERLEYGGVQEGYREGMAGRYIGSLRDLAQLGTAGIAPAMEGARMLTSGMTSAAQIRGQGAYDLWGDVGELGGIPLGEWQSERDISRFERLLGDRDDSGTDTEIDTDTLKRYKRPDPFYMTPEEDYFDLMRRARQYGKPPRV